MGDITGSRFPTVVAATIADLGRGPQWRGHLSTAPGTHRQDLLAAALADMGTRYRDYEAAIRRTFGLSGALTGVWPTRGDTHHGGACVLRLSFDDGTVYYKPRPSALSSAVHDFTNDLRARGVLSGLRTPALVCAADHYWQAAVVPSVARSTPAEGYLLGQAVALGWLLGSQDLHRENVVVNAGGVWVLDDETVLQPLLLMDGALPPLAREDLDLLSYSPLRSGLLTRPSSGSVGAPWDDLVACLGRRAARSMSAATTRGFRDGLHRLGIAWGQPWFERHLQVLRATSVRVLGRGSGVYGQLLAARQHHPGWERWCRVRLREQGLLRPWTQGLIEDELACLREGDIPHYRVRVDDTCIRGRSGVVGRVSCSAFTELLRRGQMLQDQRGGAALIWTVTAALPPPPSPWPGLALVSDPHCAVRRDPSWRVARTILTSVGRLAGAPDGVHLAWPAPGAAPVRSGSRVGVGVGVGAGRLGLLLAGQLLAAAAPTAAVAAEAAEVATLIEDDLLARPDRYLAEGPWFLEPIADLLWVASLLTLTGATTARTTLLDTVRAALVRTARRLPDDVVLPGMAQAALALSCLPTTRSGTDPVASALLTEIFTRAQGSGPIGGEDCVSVRDAALLHLAATHLETFAGSSSWSPVRRALWSRVRASCRAPHRSLHPRIHHLDAVTVSAMATAGRLLGDRCGVCRACCGCPPARGPLLVAGVGDAVDTHLNTCRPCPPAPPSRWRLRGEVTCRSIGLTEGLMGVAYHLCRLHLPEALPTLLHPTVSATPPTVARPHPRRRGVQDANH